jgi:formylglycine-generating enzyme required for sulfatase activity
MSARLIGHHDRYELDGPPHAVGGEAEVYPAVASTDGARVAARVWRLTSESEAAHAAQIAWLERAAADPRSRKWVVPLWDVGRWEGRPFEVLAWCPVSLATLSGRAPPRRALARLCEAVDDLHGVGLVHGDLKPSNVLFVEASDDPWPLLADPGRAGALTVGAAAPERYAGAAPTAASDRWAVAAMVRELLGEEVARDARLAEALRGLLHPSPHRRPAGLGPLRDALAATPRPKRRLFAVGAAAAVACGVAALGQADVGVRPNPCPPDLARDGAECVHSQLGRFVRVPGGSFRQGRDPETPPRLIPDANLRQVWLSEGFLLGAFEVTQGSWAWLLGEHPVRDRRQVLDGGVDAPCDAWKGHSLVGEALPVVCVSWFDAVRFANALSRRDGLTPAYRLTGSASHPEVRWDRGADGWRLPTEAEWERAARLNRPASAGSPCEHANTRDLDAPEHWGNEAPCHDGAPTLRPPGPAGALGLHDLEGNALEWVWDRYEAWPAGAVVDPAGPAHGAARTHKGGSWNHVPKGPAARYASSPDSHAYTTGLRLARDL